MYDVNEARAKRGRFIPLRWSFKVDGEVFTFPGELNREQAKELRGLDDNDVDGMLLILLGKEQYARFEQHEDVTLTDIAGVMEAYMRDTGLVVK